MYTIYNNGADSQFQWIKVSDPYYKKKIPKEYWKVINKKCIRHQQTSIDIDDLHKYFRDVNKPPEIGVEMNSMVDIDIANL